MSNLLSWAKSQVSHWEDSIDLMEKGYLSIIKKDGDKPVDQTEETIADRKQRMQKLKEIISKLEG